MENKIKVGYLNNFYPEKRCIIDKIESIKYEKINYYDDWNKLYYNLLRKFKIKKENLKQFVFSSNKNYDIDILHTFNSICKINTPWITTFETLIPRNMNTHNYHQEIKKYYIDKEVKKQIQLLNSSNCKKIIAISNCSLLIQKDFLREFDKDLEKQLSKKMTILHPPQEMLTNISEIEKKYEKELKEIKFIFVGNDFFRKGGEEIVKVFIKLKKQYPIKLTIISNLNINDYATLSTKKDKERILKLIKDNSDWINLYSNIPNKDVLEIIKQHNIGLLPTFADTYGYSVLEMQASGVPVITTNIRALSEINNDECGWIINIKKNKYGEAL